jgi:hypothetical protein
VAEQPRFAGTGAGLAGRLGDEPVDPDQKVGLLAVSLWWPHEDRGTMNLVRLRGCQSAEVSMPGRSEVGDLGWGM